jgi:hypothetical protein
MSSKDTLQRSILPLRDVHHVGVTTYDAKDPDTAFPPIEPLRPPIGARLVAIILLAFFLLLAVICLPQVL